LGNIETFEMDKYYKLFPDLFVNVLELHQSMINDINKRVLNWRFTLVLIKINYGQIGDQTGLFYTTNPVFYTSGNRFVRRTGIL
jgi:hypothetical protein